MELGQVIGALPRIVDPNVLTAAASRDDAAVYRIAPDRALVATVDFFTPIVDDPAAFGAIAAANSVSDVYAVGAKPMFALGITAFPREKLDTGLLEKIVAGGAGKLAEAGVPVVGGHSVDDPEPKFGYAVIGEVHPDRVVTHSGAQAGDVLFLTKPLGSGLVATAIKRGLCPPALESEAIRVMSSLNREASEAMLAAGVHAATDVTGYGLIGHLANIEGGADVEWRRVPFMDGVRELAQRDLFPGGSRRNHEAYRDMVEWGGLPELE
ncbi:MAG: selenide, water dikinase SelD, partial [Chloroflexi bacterium]